MALVSDVLQLRQADEPGAAAVARLLLHFSEGETTDGAGAGR